MIDTYEAVLIAGGYGVVGRQIAECIRQRYPDMPLIIAGRDPSKGERFARGIPNAEFYPLDVELERPLGELKPRAIIAAVNDPYDFLLMDAVQNRIPLISITRWTEKVKEVLANPSLKPLQTPVMLASGWMAGVPALISAALAKGMYAVESIDISVLYSLKDKAGPNSAEYMDRLITPFSVTLNGEPHQVYPYTDPRLITFPNGYSAQVYRFDTPDQFTLPLTTGVKTASARIAFDDRLATLALLAMIRSGFWRMISSERFTSLRRSFLFNPGPGASHQIVVDLQGRDAEGGLLTKRITMVDPLGQTHLTAVGALIQLERLLGLDGALPPSSGFVYPDTAPQIDHALQVMDQLGVVVNMG